MFAYIFAAVYRFVSKSPYASRDPKDSTIALIMILINFNLSTIVVFGVLFLDLNGKIGLNPKRDLCLIFLTFLVVLALLWRYYIKGAKYQIMLEEHSPSVKKDLLVLAYFGFSFILMIVSFLVLVPE